MRILCISIMLTGIMNILSAQTEKPINKNVADKFQSNYNRQNYNAIFDMFSQEMKDALPVDKAKEFFSSLGADAGKIVKKQFIRYEETYAVYKTNFERALFSLNISVDNNSKING